MAGPVLNNVVNDLTGNSATLTLTPPVDPDYVNTKIWFRKVSGPNNIPETTWTDGGSFIGAQGVQATTVIAGLTNNTVYEFILFATLTVAFSEPSIVRRVTITSGSLPVLGRIMNNVIATLETIRIANGFNFDVCEVQRIRSAGFETFNEFPSILVYNSMERKDDSQPVGAITNHAQVMIEGWFKAYEDIDTEIELWKADIETAILQDRRRGGDAVTTSAKEMNRMIFEGVEPYGGVLFRIDILYRTDFGNPYQRR